MYKVWTQNSKMGITQTFDFHGRYYVLKYMDVYMK